MSHSNYLYSPLSAVLFEQKKDLHNRPSLQHKAHCVGQIRHVQRLMVSQLLFSEIKLSALHCACRSVATKVQTLGFPHAMA